ncbi:hypothetical protein KP509_27G065100 [Ceratopteris richardii]|uniref:Reverse transcriptase Ty1/copia-type domain-containing protein n=1 Tax=Ceratopteris richardii TaxID=49495 RepID=A0A8T2RIJ7_CERRI|nr:hypothetical protein KP509_1Z253500 [Ceratopteris richardii]KAH7295771.1 hypothetical protein KP509_27G065100 [Ceratopteris richardii]
MTDMGPLHFCLGIQVCQHPTQGTISLNQRSYITSLLSKYHMDSCTGMDTPLPQTLNHNSTPPSIDKPSFPYAHVLSSIRYLVSCTRADICFASNYLSRYMQNPTHSHIQYLKRLLCYLKQTCDISLTYSKTSVPTGLIGYSIPKWGVIHVHINLHQDISSPLQMLLSHGKARSNLVSHSPLQR